MMGVPGTLGAVLGSLSTGHAALVPVSLVGIRIVHESSRRSGLSGTSSRASLVSSILSFGPSAQRKASGSPNMRHIEGQ